MVQFQLDLPITADVQLEVKDFSGKTVTILMAKNRKETGVYEWTLSTKEWTSGLYYLVGWIGDTIHSEKLVVIH